MFFLEIRTEFEGSAYSEILGKVRPEILSSPAENEVANGIAPPGILFKTVQTSRKTHRLKTVMTFNRK